MSMQHGSLQNVMAAQSRQAYAETEPQVGDGVTFVEWTDREPATIIRITPSGRLIAQMDDATYTYPTGEMTSCRQDRTGSVRTVVRRSDGRWSLYGSPSVTVMIGVRAGYRDMTF